MRETSSLTLQLTLLEESLPQVDAVLNVSLETATDIHPALAVIVRTVIKRNTPTVYPRKSNIDSWF